MSQTRAQEIFDERLDRAYRQTDRVFAMLMLAQWAFAIGLALVVSPHAWRGQVASVHVHVYAAVLLGGLLCSFPLALVALRPGAASTRHVIACAQMLWSALLIHLSGGRIETHFHVFGSLAFVAFYRDWRVLIPATVVVAGDHLVRGLLWPESVYGIANPEWWRFLEHAGWVVFEDVVLVMACLRGVRELRASAAQQAEVEALSESELLKKSEALAKALAELERSQATTLRAERLAAVGQLAAGVAHEIRNPLAAIRGAAAYVQKRLSEGEAAEPRVKQFLAIIEREVNVCTKIATDMLDFARERAPALAPCPVRTVCEEAVGIVSMPAGSTVRVVVDVPEGFPLPLADRDMLRQAVVNLTQNAVEAMSGREGEVRVRAETRADRWRLEVRDAGGGIAPEARKRIFEPLFTTKTKGTGLGLAIVATIAERHGGTIELESEVGRGTTVTLDLPLGAPATVATVTTGDPADAWVS